MPNILALPDTQLMLFCFLSGFSWLRGGIGWGGLNRNIDSGVLKLSYWAALEGTVAVLMVTVLGGPPVVGTAGT